MKIINPNLKWLAPLTPIRNPIIRNIQHHMAHPSWDVHDVHNFHQKSKGWNGGGYSYFIPFEGSIYLMRGRHIGAHAGRNWNGQSYGIGYQGNFETQKMTDAQLNTGIWLNAKLLKEEGNTVEAIVGHGSPFGGTSATLCPGKNFRLTELKEGVAEFLNKYSKGEIYTVVKGDILSGIAAIHSVSLQDVLKANPQITNPNFIRPGQEIVIPFLESDYSVKYKQLQEDYSQLKQELTTTKDKINKLKPLLIEANSIVGGV